MKFFLELKFLDDVVEFDSSTVFLLHLNCIIHIRALSFMLHSCLGNNRSTVVWAFCTNDCPLTQMRLFV